MVIVIAMDGADSRVPAARGRPAVLVVVAVIVVLVVVVIVIAMDEL